MLAKRLPFLTSQLTDQVIAPQDRQRSAASVDREVDLRARPARGIDRCPKGLGGHALRVGAQHIVQSSTARTSSSARTTEMLCCSAISASTASSLTSTLSSVAWLNSALST